MSEQPPKSQDANFAYGIIFGMLAGVLAYAVTLWPPAIAMGSLLGLTVGIFVSVIQSRKK